MPLSLVAGNTAAQGPTAPDERTLVTAHQAVVSRAMPCTRPPAEGSASAQSVFPPGSAEPCGLVVQASRCLVAATRRLLVAATPGLLPCVLRLGLKRPDEEVQVVGNGRALRPDDLPAAVAP